MAKALIIHRPAGGDSDWHFIPTLGFLWKQLKIQQKKNKTPQDPPINKDQEKEDQQSSKLF